MKKYKMNYGLSFFMSMSTCVYIILLMITLTDILISIMHKNIEIIIVTYSVFIGMFILFSIISLAIDGTSYSQGIHHSPLFTSLFFLA